MNTTTVSLGYIAAIIAGAGMMKLETDWVSSLYILGVAVLILVVKAVLNKFGMPVAK